MVSSGRCSSSTTPSPSSPKSPLSGSEHEGPLSQIAQSRVDELSIAAISREPVSRSFHGTALGIGGTLNSICPTGAKSRSERAATRKGRAPSWCCSTSNVSRTRPTPPAPQWRIGRRVTPVSGSSDCLHSARRSGRWRCPSALGIRRARDRVNRAAFWNPPLNSAGARYLGKTRQWRLIRRSRSEPARPMQVVFTGRSWSADRWQQLKPTCQRSRHQAQLETHGGQIGSICAMRVSCRSRDMDISVQA